MDPDQHEPTPRRFLSVADVAQMLSLDEGDIETLLTTGELPGVKIGPSEVWRIEQSVLDGYLEAKYEESRRAALWAGFDFGDITDMQDPRSH